MGEDGIPDDDLQVVSGERDLENLDPKERVKAEKKRGLIRAGMGAVGDEPEESGFEVAKANTAAMAMLGVRSKPSFAVDGLEVEDDREYGTDDVRIVGMIRNDLPRQLAVSACNSPRIFSCTVPVPYVFADKVRDRKCRDAEDITSGIYGVRLVLAVLRVVTSTFFDGY